VKRMETSGLSVTARQALGYRQIIEAGGTAEARDAIVRATKRFARRQESWFRADPRIKWLEADADQLQEQVVEHFRYSLRLA
jgi:tRNA dimethylallyltransferase